MAKRPGPHQKPPTKASAKSSKAPAHALAVKKPATLTDLLFGGKIPRNENNRTYFGRSLDLNRVERALRNAASGFMMDLTDLGREVQSLDGHLSALARKRFDRVATFEWEVVVDKSAVSRKDFDRGFAEFLADFVLGQLQRIPDFNSRLLDLEWAVWDSRAAHEIEWDIVPGRDIGADDLPSAWRINDLHWIHPRRLSFNQDRELVVLDEFASENSTFQHTNAFRMNDAPEKFVSYMPRLFNDYQEREGLCLRSTYWSFFGRLSTRERLQLMEIFGAPWRIAYWDPAAGPMNGDALDDAFLQLAQMSSRSVASLPPGVRALFVQPDSASGTVHKDIIEHVELVLSKLWLGATGTTDAIPTGLASTIGDAHLSEEDLVVAGDLVREAQRIEDQIVDRIVLLNYGPAALPMAPKFRYRLEALRDRTKEIANLNGAVNAGLEVALEEAYDRAGYRMPREDEPRLALVQVPIQPGGIPQPPRVRIVYPPGKAPPPGDLGIPPEEAIDVEGVPVGNDNVTPPARAPAAPPKVEPPQGEPVPAEAAKAGPALPFESPSGLSDDARDEPDTA